MQWNVPGFPKFFEPDFNRLHLSIHRSSRKRSHTGRWGMEKIETNFTWQVPPRATKGRNQNIAKGTNKKSALILLISALFVTSLWADAAYSMGPMRRPAAYGTHSFHTPSSGVSSFHTPSTGGSKMYNFNAGKVYNSGSGNSKAWKSYNAGSGKTNTNINSSSRNKNLTNTGNNAQINANFGPWANVYGH